MLVAAEKSANDFLLQNTSGNPHVQKPKNARKTAVAVGREKTPRKAV
jgi:hypothetical protein